MVLSEIGFGEKDAADRMCKRVRAMHAQVGGELTQDVGPYKAGTPYRADDPELLLWVLFTLIDSALVVYRKYVGEMARSDEARYWEDYKVVGELFGLERSQMPDTIDDLDHYRHEMLDGDRLFVTDWAREQARKIILDPPIPLYLKPLLETANFITIALLPDELRRQYGFSPLPPAFVRKALVAGRGRVRKDGGSSPSCRAGFATSPSPAWSRRPRCDASRSGWASSPCRSRRSASSCRPCSTGP